jgi:hypothetical protein
VQLHGATLAFSAAEPLALDFLESRHYLPLTDYSCLALGEIFVHPFHEELIGCTEASAKQHGPSLGYR